MLATMLKKFNLWWRFFKEFPESVKYSCCDKHHWRREIWTSKNKPNNLKGAGSLCLNYTHSRICFCISCKSMKNKSWSPGIVTHIHEDILAVNTKRLLLCVWPFLGTSLKGWNNNGRIHIFGKVHCGTFFNPKNISCVYVSRSKNFKRSAEVVTFECFLYLQRILRVTKQLELNAVVHSF